MFKHQWFDLLIHTDEELGDILNTSIISRKTLHEWPLSCVQHLIADNGQQWIYKTQTGPTVESQVYTKTQSELLTTALTLYNEAHHCIMLFEYIDAPLLASLTLTLDEVIKIGRDVRQQIDTIEGDVPFLFDTSSPDKWQKLVEWMLDNLQRLVDDGALSQVTTATLTALKQRLLSRRILDMTTHNIGLVHGDFKGDNLFILPDNNYKLIDWSRPFYGSIDIDFVALLDSMGHDPLSYVEKDILIAHYMLQINWLTQCATRWFIPGISTYDHQIADLIAKSTSI